MVSPDGSIHTTHTPPPLSFYNTFNPFLFIRWFFCPRSVQTSLTQNCLSQLYMDFLTVSCNNIGLEIRPQNAFIAFRALLPYANYSAE